MIEKRFQNKVVKGNMTLPAAIFIVLLLWIVDAARISLSPEPTSPSLLWEMLSRGFCNSSVSMLAGCMACTLTAYLLQEMHNTYALIRTRTDFLITTFITWMGVCFFLHPLQQGSLLQIGYVLTLFSLFRSYQHDDDVISICQAFFWFSTSCMIYPKLFLLTPTLFIGMHSFQSISPRTVFAGIIGFALPFWFLTAYAVYAEQPELVLAPLREMMSFTAPDYQHLNLTQWMAFGLMTLFNLLTSIYYLFHSYQDKIRVRTLLNHLIFINYLLMIGLLLQPNDFNPIFSLYLMIGAILQAQFFALNHNKITNILFIVCITLIALLAISNLWNPLLTSF